MAGAPSWKGTRGEWYVVVQLLVILLIALGPRTWNGWPPWPFPDGWMVDFGGLALLVGGACLAVGGGARLGKALTPLPRPSEDSVVLRETGPYRVVRHPMYCGVILAAFGWALLSRGWLTLGYVVIGFIFIAFKDNSQQPDGRVQEYGTGGLGWSSHGITCRRDQVGHDLQNVVKRKKADFLFHITSSDHIDL